MESERKCNPGSEMRAQRLKTLVLCVVVGVVINLAGAILKNVTGLPIYLDSLGTILIAALGGYLPGILVGFFTNFLTQYTDNVSIYYGTISVFIAVITTFFTKKGWTKKPLGIIAFILVLSFVAGGMGGMLTWFLFGYASTDELTGLTGWFYAHGVSRFLSNILHDYVVDLADKSLMVLIALAILRFLPEDFAERLHFDGWQQAQLSREQKSAARHSNWRKHSLRTKIIWLLLFACFSLGAAAIMISTYLYRESTVDEHVRLGEGTSALAASVVKTDRINVWLERGEKADDYRAAEAQLYEIRKSSPDIKYVYVYQIKEDGCHVIFDLDTGKERGADPGTIIEFDESFEKLLPKLLAGKRIDPIITDDTYGWLLTAYTPVYDEDGNCVCYAGADISMNRLRVNVYSFLAKTISLFLGFLVLIVAVGFWFSEYSIVLPVNTIAISAGAFAYNSSEVRAESVERLRALRIHTGDEIENLYKAIVQTTEESMRFVDDVQSKTETIEKMQNGLILVLADIVESRDLNTGQHVRKTAAYTKIIMEQMKKEGIYADQLTEGFMADVANFAPLHDVGKINIPDAILNKPGRLTDEEFARMKSHTTAGKEIISRVIDMVPASDYMNEARSLAAYHHERWDGKGYPEGLAGEDIPLSARIMAVADVFDALVSTRSYKKGFSFEKSLSIIEEGMGTQFDPQVAKAFLDAKDEVYRVAKSFGEVEDEEEGASV